MAGELVSNSYGKSRVRLTKVTRRDDRHDLVELSVDIQLRGDFATSYTDGDNAKVVPTDTMKNTVYALARNHPLESPEEFGLALARHFLDRFAHVEAAEVRLTEDAWQRLIVGDGLSPIAFSGGSSEKRLTEVRHDRGGRVVAAGIAGLLLLKTTDSAFVGFIRDEYTTLPEVTDRIFATEVRARWTYARDPVEWNDAHAVVRQAMVETFARHKSDAVQQTLLAMGRAALDGCPEVAEIELTLPNQHRIPVNLTPFGLDNPNVVFVPTDEPYGDIRGTVRRV
jgi:urate oxidase